MPTLDPHLVAEGKRCLARAVIRHLNDPNVSLIDLGWRIRDQRSHRVEPELCVRVHVRQKLREEAFEAFKERHPDRVIDPGIIGFPVDVPEARYRIHPWGWAAAAAPLNQRTRVFNPLRGGISIFNPLKYLYGTLGAKVIDRNTGAEMLLSNWHVLAGAWYAPTGMEIYQPVWAVWNGSNQRVARLSRHAMSQGLDAAVAEMTGDRTIINQQYELGPINGVTPPERGLRVVKSGRTTGVTYGVITGVDGYRVENYDGRRQVIRNIIHIAQAPEGGTVSSAGDSGSIWMEQSTNKAVGLHFAGSDSPEYGLALAMPQVLDALQVNLATT